MRTLLLASVISISFVACNGDIDNASDGLTGRAVARITSVPRDVACVSVNIAGPSRNVVDSFDVTAGQAALLRLDNLPVGNDLFAAAAYPAPCSAIAGTQPTWLSTAAVAANVAAGGVANVSLTLEPAGGANVGINFGNGDGGVDYDGGTGDGGVDYDGGGYDGGTGYDGGGYDGGTGHDGGTGNDGGTH